jgi:two-component sensor histidine kinase
MLMLYEKLYCSGDYNMLVVKSFLAPLIDETIHVLPSATTIRTEVAIDDFNLNARILSRLGIIVNELITNSVKYAFEGKIEGVIRVSVSIDGASAMLDYVDDGPGLPAETVFDRSSGFGMQLISMMVEEIGGTMEIDRSCGARFIIRWTF